MFSIDNTKEYPDRYDLGKFIPYGEKEESYDIFDSKFLYGLRNLPVAGEFTVQTEELAPDLISYEEWGLEIMWWMVLYYKGTITCFDKVRNGVVFPLPSKEDIDTLYFLLG